MAYLVSKVNFYTLVCKIKYYIKVLTYFPGINIKNEFSTEITY